MAINFPSTAGQPTDGTFTYVAAGITYSWNGESWTAAGSGATATDRTVFSATNAAPSGGGSLSYNSNTGVFTLTPPNLSSYLTSIGVLNNHSDVNISGVADGEFLRYNSSTTDWENTTVALNDISDVDINSGGFFPLNDGDILTWNSSLSAWQNVPNTVSSINGGYFGNSVTIEGLQAGTFLALVDGGHPVAIADNNFSFGTAGQVLTATGDDGSGNATGVSWSNPSALPSRTTASITSSSLAPGASANLSLVTPKAYALLKIQTSHAAWVTLYTDTVSRTSDASRTETTDPLPGSGVIAEVITTGATTQLISPGTIAYNSIAADATYLKVVNKSLSSANIQVTLTYVPLEG